MGFECIAFAERELQVDLDNWMPIDEDLQETASSSRLFGLEASHNGKHDCECHCVECIAYAERELQVDLDNWMPIDEDLQGTVSLSRLFGLEASHSVRGIVKDTSHAMREAVADRGLRSYLGQSNISRTRQVENAVNSTWNPFGRIPNANINNTQVLR